ncbi:MAG TPA: sulfatase [Polyangiales bacterium]|nr:sulfatase [Polyangiales bacterium]
MTVRGGKLSGSALIWLLCACPSADKAPEVPTTGAAKSHAEVEEADPIAAAAEIAIVEPGPPPEGLEVYLDLQDKLHLADYEHHGLSIGFGTSARMKYTIGHWKTGWGKDGVDDASNAFTQVLSTHARLYLPLTSDREHTLRMRLKPLSSRSLQPILNNAALAEVPLNHGPDFAEYEVAIPAGRARAGENQLTLRFEDPLAADKSEPLALVAALRIEPKLADKGGVKRAAAVAVRAVSIGGFARKAISVVAPAALRYHVEIPKTARLSMRAGAAKGGVTLVLRVTPEGGNTTELWRGLLSDAWLLQQVPLQAYAGSVVRLEFAFEGNGSAALASPMILTDSAPPPPQRRATPQNVVVVLIDTMRADHLQPYNATTRVKTPAVAALAAQGTVFESAQAPENWTKPSVASVLTGLYPASHGTKTGDAKLSDKATLLSEVFKEAGYATASFLANGYVSDKFGFNQGWDTYTNYIREKRSSNAENVYRDAARWIDEHKKRPFFVYVQTIDPHVPYDPPEEMIQLYHPEPYHGVVSPRSTADQLGRAKLSPPKVVLNDDDRKYLEALYDGEVTYHDKYLGVFIEKLKRLGLYDKTLFVVTADHGEEFYDHQSYGHGHSLYQELIHVPWILRYPGAAPRRITDTVSTVDIAPTVLSSLGLQVPAVMEGSDRSAMIFGANAPAFSSAVSDFLDDRRSLRAGRWKLVLRGLTPTMFDLESDPHELTELDMAEHPVAARYCRVLLGQFLGAVDRGDWLNADPTGRSIELKGVDTDIDEATEAGLRALGYAR